jgi:alkylation response protein AidB-like acyl-CoA dehydrogenase
VLATIAGVSADEIATLRAQGVVKRMELAFTTEQDVMRDAVRAPMQRHAPPEAIRAWDGAQSFREPVYAAWAKAGLFRLPFPQEIDGLGGSVLDLAIVAEEVARGSGGMGRSWRAGS